MASVTCGLTAEDWDQFRDLTLISSVGLPLYVYILFFFYREQFSAVSKDILEILSQELDTGVYRNNNSYNLPEPHPPKK